MTTIPASLPLKSYSSCSTICETWTVLLQNVHVGLQFPEFLIRCYGNIVHMCTHIDMGDRYVCTHVGYQICRHVCHTGMLEIYKLFISLSSVSDEVLATTNLGQKLVIIRPSHTYDSGKNLRWYL